MGDPFNRPSAEKVGIVKIPRVKIVTGASGVDDGDVSSSNPLPVTIPPGTSVGIAGIESDYSPQYGAATEVPVTARFDPSGNLLVRAQVHGDEGGYRTNFANTSLAVTIGTCTFTNGSDQVTGTGFDVSQIHLGDSVYLTADGSTAAKRVDYITATALTLASPYTGAGGTGAGSAQVLNEKIGTGCSFTVTNGQISLVSGTTSASVLELERDADFLPLGKLGRFSISQRIANQNIRYGFYDENSGGNARWFFWFDYNGIDQSKVDCVCAWNPTNAPTGAEIKTVTVNLPLGTVSAYPNDHKIELLKDRVVFTINNVIVYTEYGVVPGPMDFQTSTMRIVNGTSPASSTTVLLDYEACSNIDIVPTEPASASGVPLQPGNTTQGQLVYSDDLAAILLKMTLILDAIESRIPTLTAQREMPVRVVSASNAAVNVAQVGGQTTASGAGASGNGAARVTPANDTIAGSPQIWANLLAMTDVGAQTFRDRVTT